MYFNRTVKVTPGELTNDYHEFEAVGIPQAKKVCRDYYRKLAKQFPDSEIRIELRQRPGWQLASVGYRGDIVGALTGHASGEPAWHKQ